MGKAAAVLAGLVLVGLLAAAPADAVPAYKILGTDEAGDASADMLDVRSLGVRRTKAGISVRIWFEDLPDVAPAGPFALWNFRHDRKPRRECCELRVNFRPQPELLFNYRADRCRDCWRSVEVKGRYDATEDTVTFFVPLTIAPFKIGDRIYGCPPADEDGLCDRSGWSLVTSPGSYGDDFLTTTRRFEIR